MDWEVSVCQCLHVSMPTPTDVVHKFETKKSLNNCSIICLIFFLNDLLFRDSGYGLYFDVEVIQMLHLYLLFLLSDAFFVLPNSTNELVTYACLMCGQTERFNSRDLLFCLLPPL